ncbi:MAG: NADH-quinone oxidoreductase subunit N [Rickettsiaceae bacterium]|nr:NADH-quinone oxidoreductase subunit N [Rickettsiaceae bacterium]
MMSFIEKFLPIIPEILVALTSIICLIVGLYKDIAKAIWWIAGSLLIVIFCIMILFYSALLSTNIELGGIFNTHLGLWQKLTLIIFSLLLLIFHGGMGRVKFWRHGHHEYISLLLISLAASMIAIAARDFLILYASLELMSLVGYIFACYDREYNFSTESGIKYLVLGSFVSSIMAFGLSYIYGFGGSLLFSDINTIIVNNSYSPALIIGIALFASGILFKLSLAPFHLWTQDAYQGAPLISVAYFASMPKFTALIVFINLLEFILPNLKPQLQHSLMFLGIITMLIGSIGAIVQTSLKRLIGYSAILNSGFILLAVSLASDEGYGAAVLYQIIYSFSVIGLVAALAITSEPLSEDYAISHLAGFGTVKKIGAFAITIFAFSLAGLPPLAGFFGKYYIISALVHAGHIKVGIIALLITVIASCYYINIVKQIYFCPPNMPQIRIHESSSLALLIAISLVFVLFFPFIA